MTAASIFTQTQADQLQRAVSLMAGAPEIPFDSTCMESVAKAAVSLGYATATGPFLQQCKDKPISTLIALMLHAGGAPGGVLNELAPT